jgi:hypothetical protein
MFILWIAMAVSIWSGVDYYRGRARMVLTARVKAPARRAAV